MTATDRKIQALRNLAERPGTEAEGRLAREKLNALLAKNPVKPKFEFRPSPKPEPIKPTYQNTGVACWCSSTILRNGECAYKHTHQARIESVRRLVHANFRKGSRVYYNAQAYPDNCPATVVGYAKQGTWIRLKFDHLKTIRSVPSLYGNLWMLSPDPLSEFEADKRRHGGITAP